MDGMDPDEATAHLPLQIGDEMVNFSCDSTMGMFNPFHDVIDGHWSMLVTFPKDFDPVGTTELGHMAKLKEEFEARNVKLFALSCDTKMSHRRWVDETQELQECSIGFPMIVDEHGEISRLLGLVRPKVSAGRARRREARTPGLTASGAFPFPPQAVNAVRSLIPATLVIVTDIDRRIRMMMQYPVTTGRNFYEILRAIDTLQLTMCVRARARARGAVRLAPSFTIARRFSRAGSSRWRHPRTGCRARTSSSCRRCRPTPPRAFSPRCARTRVVLHVARRARTHTRARPAAPAGLRCDPPVVPANAAAGHRGRGHVACVYFQRISSLILVLPGLLAGSAETFTRRRLDFLRRSPTQHAAAP